MSVGLITFLYTISAILFIFSLAGFSKKEKAERSNNYGIVGMIIALITTLLKLDLYNIIWMILAISIGGVIGIFLAKKIKMTKIPELVAILHSLVGLAAVLVGFNNYLNYGLILKKNIINICLIETYISIFIGALTFSGSVIAFIKLCGNISSKPLIIPNRHKINMLSLTTSFLLFVLFLYSKNIFFQLTFLILMIIVALLLGCHLVISISGADMPIIISMLNSYSGWAAATSGFVLSNNLLIIVGALVGSSGSILSYIMCKSMNRSLKSVIIGNYENKKLSFSISKQINGYQEISIKDTTNMLKNSISVFIVPGYGMAVSQAQHSVAKIIEKLNLYDIKVSLAIHPIAGRLPGHMNILLAEAKIPHEIIFDIDEANSNFINTDTVLVIGANDTVNPSAREDPESPIAGMSVLEVWKAQNVIVFKRSMNTGYAGMDNPLFYRNNTYMLFGNAKSSIDNILKEI